MDEPPAPPRSIRLVWAGAFIAWIAAVGGSIGALSEYASRPGPGAQAPTSWPVASHLSRAPGRATLVMISHTRCACTRASLHELERLMARAGSRAEAFVVFVGPHEPSAVLDLRVTARAIPGVRVVEDETEARLFGAATSGQVLLYAPGGELVFSGGITPSRGHEGDSNGGEILRSFVVSGHGPEANSSSPLASGVFGCALFEPGTSP